MKKRLVILFDGTWNKLESKTNVCRLHELIADTGGDGQEQRQLYVGGVGTRWYEHFRGGAFGKGLSQNIKGAYDWLARNHQEGDELFVFGFSRGAYSARSLVGLIRKCGVLAVPDAARVEQAYDLYRDKNIAPDSPEAISFRREFSREIRVRFIGVWDTVGSLGIPVSGVPFSRDYYQWHDTKLSSIVDYAYHALALDEHRADYEPALWTERKPENIDVEQRWFIGAHANIGGGYANDALPNLPLGWLSRKAEKCGLRLKGGIAIGADDYLAPITDSYGEFMYGAYRVYKMGKRYYRPMGAGVSETVDDSVWQRWDSEAARYRPPSLNVDLRGRPFAASAS